MAGSDARSTNSVTALRPAAEASLRTPGFRLLAPERADGPS